MYKILLSLSFLILFTGCSVMEGNVIGIPLGNYDDEGSLKVNLTAPTDDNGKLEVIIQDQDTPTIDYYLARNVSGVYIILSNTTPDTNIINLVSTVGLTVGDWVGMFQDTDSPAAYFGEIKSIVGNNITVYPKVPKVFSPTKNAVLFELDRELNEDCSNNEVIHFIENDASVPIDLTRMIISMNTDDIPDLTKFGDIVGGLNNGTYLRKRNADGTYENIFNFKQNNDFKIYCFDYEVTLGSNPAQAVNGIKARCTWGGQEKHGVVIRLSKNERLELVCNDDLSDLLLFRIVVQGHFTDMVE